MRLVLLLLSSNFSYQHLQGASVLVRAGIRKDEQSYCCTFRSCT